MTDPVHRAREALTRISALAEAIARESGSPYPLAVEVWSTAMGAIAPEGTEGEQCHALWLQWGALTDWVERRPGERDAAEAAMRRAADEWLRVADDEQAWRVYFDRWLYDELGYARPEG